jgi:hypothetical protein
MRWHGVRGNIGRVRLEFSLDLLRNERYCQYRY